jgi:hypothetical protein
MKHMECGGGPTVHCDDGIRVKCTKCGEEETWEQAARAWHAEFERIEPEVRHWRCVKEEIKRFARSLHLGEILK